MMQRLRLRNLRAQSAAMSVKTFVIGLLALWALSVITPAIQRWNLRRLVQASLGLDRICRKADLVLRELRFCVIDSIRYSDGMRVICVQFSFKHVMHGVLGNGWTVLDPVEVFVGRDAHNRSVEAQIISAIAKARAYYEQAT